jgi:hypothetical protein
MVYPCRRLRLLDRRQGARAELIGLSLCRRHRVAELSELGVERCDVGTGEPLREIASLQDHEDVPLAIFYGGVSSSAVTQNKKRSGDRSPGWLMRVKSSLIPMVVAPDPKLPVPPCVATLEKASC